MPTIRVLGAIAGTGLLLTVMLVRSAPAQAQEFTSKAIRPIVPFAPGVPSDIAAQVIADGLRFAHRRAVLSI